MHPLPNRDFMRVLREAWDVQFGVPATAWMIKAGTLAAGRISFEYPEWQGAAQDLVRRMRERS